MRLDLSVAGGSASLRVSPFILEAPAYFHAAGLVFVLCSPRFRSGERGSSVGSCSSPTSPTPYAWVSDGWRVLGAPPAPPPSPRGPPSCGVRLLGGHR
ncbi:hypothetical protein NDU88_009484 [Pleurodeles waltl]|uniref:Uncharacterized protein n=1 Tax=Pleurodeles waltl TaxID=8319 RepID=A0AAV7RYJ2_PLEWA|nr:hypothetical protein NDU88_009484 [Pleurodeles waltl]